MNLSHDEIRERDPGETAGAAVVVSPIQDDRLEALGVDCGHALVAPTMLPNGMLC